MRIIVIVGEAWEFIWRTWNDLVILFPLLDNIEEDIRALQLDSSGIVFCFFDYLIIVISLASISITSEILLENYTEFEEITLHF